MPLDPVGFARRHAVARRIGRDWRLLTGGGEARDADRPTLVACSGGVDSSALAIGLAGVKPRVVLGHVVHDLRDREDALGDRDSVRALGERLGLRVLEREAPVRARGGNLEGEARRGRYEALRGMAAEAGCRFVVTAHHADDQLETVLMRLLRGSGPRGLGGIMATRALGDADGGISVARPMLGMAREEAVRLCEDFGWAWREDASNRDVSFFRNALRAEVLPVLKRLRPDAAERVSGTAEVCRLAADAIERRARLKLNRATLDVADSAHRVRLDRAVLAAAPMAVRCETLRMVLRDFGGSGMDRAGWNVLRPAAGAIGDGRNEPRTFRVGSIVVSVRAHEIRISEVADE